MNKFLHLLLLTGMLLVSPVTVISQSYDSLFSTIMGAVVRGDPSRPELALVFTGDEFADGAVHIKNVLHRQGVKASFFLTGNFYRNQGFKSIIDTLREEGHYLGAHSDHHLLYCDWVNRDSLLVTKKQFTDDLTGNYRAMQVFGIERDEASFFLPPYEWYNDSIASWTGEMKLQLVNYTHGTLSHTDYTVPGSDGYRSSREIYRSILDYESTDPDGLNGFILLLHIGTEAGRTDKFYLYLEELVEELHRRGYRFRRIDELLEMPGKQHE